MSNGWCWENNFLQYHPCVDSVALLICILHKGEFHCLYAVPTILCERLFLSMTSSTPHCLSVLQNIVTWAKQLSILLSQHISFFRSAIYIIIIIIAYCKILSGYKWRGLCSQPSYARLHTLSVFTLIALNLIYAPMLGESLTPELLHQSFGWKWLGSLNRKTKSPIPYQRCQNSQSTRNTKQNGVVVHLLHTIILK